MIKQIKRESERRTGWEIESMGEGERENDREVKKQKLLTTSTLHFTAIAKGTIGRFKQVACSRVDHYIYQVTLMSGVKVTQPHNLLPGNLLVIFTSYTQDVCLALPNLTHERKQINNNNHQHHHHHHHNDTERCHSRLSTISSLCHELSPTSTLKCLGYALNA